MIIFSIILSIILVLIILIQPQNGGMDKVAALGNVSKTNNIVTRATWILGGILCLVCLGANAI